MREEWMRNSMITCGLLALMACAGDTEFSSTPDDSIPETGVAELQLSDAEITISEINYSEQISKSAEFTISNIGDNTLQLYLVGLADSGDGAIYIEEETSLSLLPGISREFAVVATLTEFISAEGSLRIKSNDSDYLDHRLPVYAFPAGWEDTGGADTGSGGDDTGSGGDDTGSSSDTGSTG
jgi:hypothetical protein